MTIFTSPQCTLLCNAHVEIAARGVALVSIISVLIRFIIEVVMQTWDLREIAILEIDIWFSIFLLIGVYQRKACLIVPYLAYLVLNIFVQIIVATQVVTGPLESKALLDLSTNSGMTIYCASVSVHIAFMASFFKVAFNFLFYLLGRVNEIGEPHSVQYSPIKYSSDLKTTIQEYP